MRRNTQWVCDHCDDPVTANAHGWYRCRSCGYESLRDSALAPVVISASEASGTDDGAGLVSLFDK